MTDAIDFHDYNIESLLVEARARRLVLRARNNHEPDAPTLVAEFSGLAGYCLVGDVLGTTVFELDERDPVDLYKQFSPHLQTAYHSTGGHAAWVQNEGRATAFLVADRIRGFELSSSIGAIGAIWCRDFDTRIETAASG